MRAYVINLEERVDRWQSVEAQASTLALPLVKIKAVTINDLSASDTYVAPGVAATWKSHQLAMSTFLESREDYGLILEDDFLITHLWDKDWLDIALSTKPDFFQFGYLVTGPIDLIDLHLHNLLDRGLKLLFRTSQYSNLIKRRFGNRLLVREQEGIKSQIVPNDIRAGGQAYLVSRKFAEAAQFMNSPAFTSADGMFMALGDVRSFKMCRSRKSLINQTDSVTSVDQRYL